MEFEVLPGQLRLVYCRADGTSTSVTAIEELLLRAEKMSEPFEAVIQDIAEPMFRTLLESNAQSAAASTARVT